MRSAFDRLSNQNKTWKNIPFEHLNHTNLERWGSYLFAHWHYLLVAEGGANESAQPTQSVPMPNTNWNSQTKATPQGSEASYTLGQGNPAAVALPQSAYLANSERPGIKYVTPVAEVELINFLNSRDLNLLMVNCQREGAAEGLGLKYPDDFDVNKWLVIDAKTGRKEINNIDQFSEWLATIKGFEQEFTKSTLSTCFKGDATLARATIKSVNTAVARINAAYTNILAR